MSERRQTRLVGRFNAEGTDGRTYTVEEYREEIYVTMLDKTTNRIEGMRSFKLAGGGHINKYSEDDFEIVETGMKLRRQ